MTSFKDELLAWAQTLPDDCTLEDVETFIHIRRGVEEAMADIDAGRVVPHAEAMRRVQEWLKSSGQPAH